MLIGLGLRLRLVLGIKFRNSLYENLHIYMHYSVHSPLGLFVTDYIVIYFPNLCVLTSELYLDWNDNVAAIFAANLKSNWPPVPVPFYCFLGALDNRANKKE